MKPWEIAGLGAKARAQIEAALAIAPTILGGKTQRTAHGKLHSRCATCGKRIAGEKAVIDHLAETGHHRYEVIL